MRRFDEAEIAAEQAREAAAVRRPPDDRPGAEGVPSRADSRRGALAAGRDISYGERLDKPIDDGEPTPRDVLTRFRPADAGLPEVTEEQAAEYITQNADRRPWLAAAKDSEPCVQRVLVAIDQGLGHALERHEGFADNDRLRRRVTALEDPAQLDDAKRIAGIDGCKPGNRRHGCGAFATAIQDPAAFATAFVRGVENPEVRAVLEQSFRPGRRPPKISLSVEGLLGSDGLKHCSGYGLKPVDGSLQKAQDERAAWVQARSDFGRTAGVPEPECTPLEFDGATVEYFFRARREGDGCEIATMYLRPRRDSVEGV